MFSFQVVPCTGCLSSAAGGEYQAYPQYAHTPQYAYVTDPNWPARYAGKSSSCTHCSVRVMNNGTGLQRCMCESVSICESARVRACESGCVSM